MFDKLIGIATDAGKSSEAFPQASSVLRDQVWLRPGAFS
jgi:hypothetical protein